MCSTDHASIDKSSKRPIGHRGKKRKLASDALPQPRAQEDHTISASKANETSVYVPPHKSDDTARDVSTIPSDLLGKLGLIGSVEVLRDLKYTLFRLRSYPTQLSLVPDRGIDPLYTGALNDTLRLL